MINGTVIENDEQGLIESTQIQATTTYKLAGKLRDAGYDINPRDTIIGSLGAIIVDMAERIRRLENAKT